MRICRRLIAISVFLVVTGRADAQAAPVEAQAAPTREAIRYTLRFPAPQTNYLEVEDERNVEGVAATAGGTALAIEKTVRRTIE